MRKSLLFLLNTLLAAATLCVVSCGIDDVDAEDGAIQFELYDTEGTLIEGLQSMKFGATTAYTLKSAFVTYTEVTAVRTYEQRTTIRYQVSEISAFYPDCW